MSAGIHHSALNMTVTHMHTRIQRKPLLDICGGAWRLTCLRDVARRRLAGVGTLYQERLHTCESRSRD